MQDHGFDVSIRLSPLIEEFMDFTELNALGINKGIVEFLRINTWICRWLAGVEFSKYTHKQSGYWHLTLEDKIRVFEKMQRIHIYSAFDGGLVFAGVWLCRIWDDYRAPEEEYEELKQYVKETPEEEILENPYANNETQKEAEGNAEMVIDFEKLQQINPDIVAWIRIEAAGIDYPVVQGTDNKFYLHHTFRGEKSIAGSIFMD